MKRIIQFILLFLLPFFSWSNPSPFDITINKTTLNEVKKKYGAKYMRKNPLGNNVYDVDIASIKFDGIQKLMIVTDKNYTVRGLIAIVNKDRFNDLCQILESKYQLINKKTPLVGNKEAIFIDDRTTIVLDSTHMEFDMTLAYMDSAMFNKTMAAIEHEEHNTNNSERSIL